MTKFIFMVGIVVVVATAFGVAGSAPKDRPQVAGIGGAVLVALLAWLLLFRLLFGVAS